MLFSKKYYFFFLFWGHYHQYFDYCWIFLPLAPALLCITTTFLFPSFYANIVTRPPPLINRDWSKRGKSGCVQHRKCHGNVVAGAALALREEGDIGGWKKGLATKREEEGMEESPWDLGQRFTDCRKKILIECRSCAIFSNFHACRKWKHAGKLHLGKENCDKNGGKRYLID